MPKLKKFTRGQRKHVKELADIAGEFSYLADAYAGGESDTVKELDKRFEKVCDKLDL